MDVTDADFEAAVSKLEVAITAGNGAVKPIRRVELEILDNGAIRWSLWEERQGLHGAVRWSLVYSGVLHTEELAGSLVVTKMLLEVQAGQHRN
jgi:hypothetical protein